jgi:hypothetical protein
LIIIFTYFCFRCKIDEIPDLATFWDPDPNSDEYEQGSFLFILFVYLFVIFSFLFLFNYPLGRIYRPNFVTNGFSNRLLVRLLHNLPIVEVGLLWRNGIAVKCSDSKAFISYNAKNYELDLRVRVSKTDPALIVNDFYSLFCIIIFTFLFFLFTKFSYRKLLML